jgi:MFS family permease
MIELRLALQYLPLGGFYGFLYTALPVLLRAGGAESAAVGLLGLLALPTGIAFLWAPLVDRGARAPAAAAARHRRWMIVTQVLAAAALALVAAIDPTAAAGLDRRVYLTVLVLLFVISILFATKEVAANALLREMAADAPGLMARANGLRAAALFLGTWIGSGVLTTWYDDIGWRDAFLITAVLGILMLPAMIGLGARDGRGRGRADAEAAGGAESLDGAFAALGHMLRHAGGRRRMAGLSIVAVPLALPVAMFPVFLADAGLTMARIGLVLGGGGTIASLAAAWAGGWLAGRLGAARVLVALVVLQVAALAAWTGFALAAARGLVIDGGALAALGVLQLSVYAGFTVVLNILAMERARPAHAGTDIAVLRGSFYLTATAAHMAGGWIADPLGWPAYFGLTTLVFALVLPLLRLADPAAIRPPSARPADPAAAD